MRLSRSIGGLHIYIRASYSSNIFSSPGRNITAYKFDSSFAVASAVMNSRSSAFAKRSQSFVDCSGGHYRSASSQGPMPSKLPEWGSPDGKVDWGLSGEEANKLRKSASFCFRRGNGTPPGAANPRENESDVSWVNSMVKDAYMMPHLVDQLYIE